MSLTTLKSIHILAVTLFVGNIIVSAFWKALADRTREVGVIRYATRLVILTDVFFTAGGIALLLATGHAMAPGATPLTRTAGASSSASARVSDARPALATLYSG